MNSCRRFMVVILVFCPGILVLTSAGQEAVSEAGGREPAQVRDPFWPVGYVPRKPVKPAQVDSSAAKLVIPESARLPVWEEARKLLDIKGISLIGRDRNSGQSKYLAMVTGKFVEEGDTVSVAFEGFVYRWKVTGISEEGVSLRKIDARPR